MGSVIGREHMRLGKNNQDAYASLITEQCAIAVVCDGCGSSLHSEVGAKLGAHIVVDTLYRTWLNAASAEDCGSPAFWRSVGQSVRYRLNDLVLLLGAGLHDNSGLAIAQLVRDYLLFTTVGVLITDTITVLFGNGDGVMVLNEAVIPLPQFANNAPPYLAYGLLESVPFTAEQLQFQIYRTVPTDAVQSLLIGTDGVQDLMAIADQPLPGKSEVVGTIAQFWQSDRYFSNPDQVRRRLALINREVHQPDWQTQQVRRAVGLLPDDTTLVVMRGKG